MYYIYLSVPKFVCNTTNQSIIHITFVLCNFVDYMIWYILRHCWTCICIDKYPRTDLFIIQPYLLNIILLYFPCGTSHSHRIQNSMRWYFPHIAPAPKHSFSKTAPFRGVGLAGDFLEKLSAEADLVIESSCQSTK